MKAHVWEIEIIDGGSTIGKEEFWICHACGASGGPVLAAAPHWPPFLAGVGLEHPLSQDCAEAAKEIKALGSRHLG